MNKIEFGDCRDIMRKWAKEGVKVQTCVTSPPYYAVRDYGHDGQLGLEETPQKYVEAMVEVFRCVWDILDDTGVVWANFGDSYVGSGNSGGKGMQDTMYRGENLPTKKIAGLKPKNILGIPWRVAFALQDDGWILRQDIIWSKLNAMPESVTDRCTKAHEYIFLLAKQPNYYFDHEAMKEQAVKKPMPMQASAEAVRLKSTGPMARGKEGFNHQFADPDRLWAADGTRNKRSVWTVNPQPYKGAHFAVYPESLIEPCILAGSRRGDIVLDPFMGSGTTAAVATKFGRQYLGCELNPEYEALQQQRIKAKQLSPTVKVAAHSAYPTTIKKLF